MAKERTPDEIEASLRKSAEKFAADLLAARDAGLAVTWPSRPEDLAAIEISATAASAAKSVEQPADPQPAPAATGSVGATGPAASAAKP